MVKRILCLGCVVTLCAVLSIGIGVMPNKMPFRVGATAAEAEGGIDISAKAAFLVEANSGKVLFAKDENKRLPIASMVKITTLAVIYDALEAGQITMADMVNVSRDASGMGGSQAFLDFDSEYSVEELVKSIIIASANDSCVAMAEHLAGSEAEFVVKMNELASRLGMENTNYVNVTGLPAADSYSSAADVAKVYQYIMRSPFYNYKVNGEPMNKIWMYDLLHPSGRVTGLTNTNRHARFFNGVLGGKTGFTAEAGHCITVAAERGAIKPIAVIIGAGNSATRFEESGSLLSHVLNGYENKLIVDHNLKIGAVKLKNAFQDYVDAFARESYFDLVKKGDKDAAPTVTVELAESIKAPINRDTVLGKIIVTDEGNVVREIDVVAGTVIDALSYWDAVRKVTRVYKIS